MLKIYIYLWYVSLQYHLAIDYGISGNLSTYMTIYYIVEKWCTQTISHVFNDSDGLNFECDKEIGT